MNQKLRNIYICAIVIFICAIIFPTLSFITCPKVYLFQIGTKTNCMNEQGWRISCDNRNVKYAEIECVDGYYNHLGNQTLECDLNTGDWVKIPWRCFPPPLGCNYYNELQRSFPNITLFNEPTKYPTWYVEILKRPPINGEQNILPGVIMGPRLIITWAKYFDRNTFNPKHYTVRLYKNGLYEDYKIGWIEFKEDDEIYNQDDDTGFERFCFLILAKEKYLKLEANATETACFDFDHIELLSVNKWFIEVMRARLEYNLVPNYPRQCLVQHVDEKRVASLCYSSLKTQPLSKCPERVPALQTICQIGYKNKNSESDDILTMCVEGRWETNYNSSEDCELVCGEVEESQALDKPQLLIHRGEKTVIKKAPWHVAIFSNNTNSEKSHEIICSGTIVHKNVVISAAHCFFDGNVMEELSSFLIGAGRIYYDHLKKETPEQFVRVHDVKFPRQYSKFKNDICVVIVKSYFTFTSAVKPVCIDWAPTIQNRKLDDGTEGHIFGWGHINSSRALNEQLLTTTLHVLNSNECEKLYNITDTISDEHFCGVNENGSTACRGDSGGGFVIEKVVDNKKRYFLWGVISIGIGLEYCTENFITVLTNLQYFQEVKDIIQQATFSLNRKKFAKLGRHQIYAHSIWEPSQWVRDELKFRLSFEANPESDYTDD